MLKMEYINKIYQIGKIDYISKFNDIGKIEKYGYYYLYR